MLRIFERLKQEDYPNCASLARELETSSRTIQRDVDYMRDQLGLPIEYDASQHGFYFTQEVHSFPTIAVSQGELLALLVAQRAIEQYRGTPYHGQLAPRRNGRLRADPRSHLLQAHRPGAA
jgi:proteasome accessory factor B